MKTVLAAFSVLVLCATYAQAAIVFDNSFECGGAPGSQFPCEGWDVGVEQPGRLEISTDLPFPGSGTRSLKQVWISASGAGNQPSLYKDLSPTMDTIFLRYVTHRSTTWTQSTNGSTKRLIIGNLGYPRAMILDLYNAYTFVIECPYNINNRQTTVTWSTGIAPTPGGWDTVEVEYRLNTPGSANGIVRMWINNVLRLERLNLEMRYPAGATATPGCGSIGLPTYKVFALQFFTQSGVGTVYSDRIAVGDTRIGLVGGTPPPPPTDTVSPTAPTAVTVQ